MKYNHKGLVEKNYREAILFNGHKCRSAIGRSAGSLRSENGVSCVRAELMAVKRRLPKLD
jgi:hypothetical protein